jgi:hypothetical protein
MFDDNAVGKKLPLTDTRSKHLEVLLNSVLVAKNWVRYGAR